jgi:hypothetical protein
MQKEEWKRYSGSKFSSKKFYKGKLSPASVEALFFADDELLNEMKDAELLQIDGTFSSCPKKPEGIYQLLNIQFRKEGHVRYLVCGF